MFVARIGKVKECGATSALLSLVSEASNAIRILAAGHADTILKSHTPLKARRSPRRVAVPVALMPNPA